jgi:hypothetical protein
MTPRLTSDMWVHAFLRRVQVQGLFAAVLHKGHAAAGAVAVVVNHLNGTATLLQPPPGPAYDDAGERRFLQVSNAQGEAAVSAAVARLRRFDTDLWVVEVEDRSGIAGLLPETP